MFEFLTQRVFWAMINSFIRVWLGIGLFSPNSFATWHHVERKNLHRSIWKYSKYVRFLDQSDRKYLAF